MKRLNLSTKMKAAVGYAAVIALFLAAVWLIVGVLDSLTRSDGAERTINNRQRATNDVVSRLYQAEVIGQALSAGQTDLFQSYVDAMMPCGCERKELTPLMVMNQMRFHMKLLPLLPSQILYPQNP